MSYTYLNASELGPRFQGATPGSDEFNFAMAELMAVYAECGVEVRSTGFSSALGRTISIQTAPDVESATRCQVLVAQAGIVQNLVSGPYTSLEDMIALQS
jgi:hypothetical protein